MNQPSAGPPLLTTHAQFASHVRRPFDDTARKALAMEMRPDDVIISTFPKCGTTWMQQIAHCLRSRGDMSFTEISHVIPWMETGHIFGNDVFAAQPFPPRMYKSHMQLSALPRGARIINVIREPGDALLSFYNFFSHTLLDPAQLPLEVFAAETMFCDRRDKVPNMFEFNYFEHLVDFHTAAYDGPVLYLSYEAMQRDLPAVVRQVAAFAGIALDAGLEALTLERASFAFMAAHKEQFTDRAPWGGRFQKVVGGRVGDSHTRLSPALREQLAEAWKAQVTPVLGYASYAELEAALPTLNRG